MLVQRWKKIAMIANFNGDNEMIHLYMWNVINGSLLCNRTFPAKINLVADFSPDSNNFIYGS